MSQTLTRVPLFLRYPQKTVGSSILGVRHAGGMKGYWNPDWRADPRIPKTQLEKIAAAKKYNLHPSDYKTFSEDDKNQHGDYPNLRPISFSERDPYEPWDMPEVRRNFGEPLHIDFDLYTGERCSTERELHSKPYMLACFLGFMGGMFLFWYVTRPYFTFMPQMPKHYPYHDHWVTRGGDPATLPPMKFYEFPTTTTSHSH
ncbi:NADH dehydrogenase [ubiquinone] 1 beta subcomplex subunit 8, mitochondrial-like [Paramacrobiotus metropolitanus]|uniref:NADH dehydrogenase [ubiquinone] 1 beta subcomplex subunit 8, mitochondrial-like n=1 Tax=Paramacrobiotus metropolitanus TaxID=2943436 RepID=UPI002445BA8B|nr:NADH dehydrogenase [ubiquinone] 1 beta subcomplex subunit 8, mitochondrial-like [Paramacrobiotus metropolitanus]